MLNLIEKYFVKDKSLRKFLTVPGTFNPEEVQVNKKMLKAMLKNTRIFANIYNGSSEEDLTRLLK